MAQPLTREEGLVRVLVGGGAAAAIAAKEQQAEAHQEPDHVGK